jgi:hypothetical protein
MTQILGLSQPDLSNSKAKFLIHDMGLAGGPGKPTSLEDSFGHPEFSIARSLRKRSSMCRCQLRNSSLCV